MPNEEIEWFIHNSPVFIIEAIINIIGIINSLDVVNVNNLRVPVIYKDFVEMFYCALICMLIACLLSEYGTIVLMFGMIDGGFVDPEHIFSRVCRWLGITFFVFAICIFIICALLGFMT